MPPVANPDLKILPNGSAFDAEKCRPQLIVDADLVVSFKRLSNGRQEDCFVIRPCDISLGSDSDYVFRKALQKFDHASPSLTMWGSSETRFAEPRAFRHKEPRQDPGIVRGGLGTMLDLTDQQADSLRKIVVDTETFTTLELPADLL
jgi:hypothetical protein